MSSFLDKFLSKQQCDFRKGYSTQQCFLTSLENWIRVVDRGQMFGALLTDLSKAFDCLDHELLIASSISIHDRNIQCLATEMYEVSNRLSPPAVSNYFYTKKLLPLQSAT